MKWWQRMSVWICCRIFICNYNRGLFRIWAFTFHFLWKYRCSRRHCWLMRQQYRSFPRLTTRDSITTHGVKSSPSTARGHCPDGYFTSHPHSLLDTRLSHKQPRFQLPIWGIINYRWNRNHETIYSAVQLLCLRDSWYQTKSNLDPVAKESFRALRFATFDRTMATSDVRVTGAGLKANPPQYGNNGQRTQHEI